MCVCVCERERERERESVYFCACSLPSLLLALQMFLISAEWNITRQVTVAGFCERAEKKRFTSLGTVT